MLRTANKDIDEEELFDVNLIESTNLAIQPTLFSQPSRGKLMDLRIEQANKLTCRIIIGLRENSIESVVKNLIQLGTVLQHNYLTIQYFLNELAGYQFVEVPPLHEIEALSRAQARMCERIVGENIPKNTFAILALAKGIGLFVALLGNDRVNAILKKISINDGALFRAQYLIDQALPVVRDWDFWDQLMRQEVKNQNSDNKMTLFLKKKVATVAEVCKKQVSEIRQKKEEKKLSRLKMFSNSDDTKSNIDDIINFLKENKEFFAAPFQNQKKFADWVSGRRLRKTLIAWEEGHGGKIQQLSMELKKALKVGEIDVKPQLLQFHEAILGENGKKNGLINGKIDRIRHLLLNNADLCAVLIKYMKEPAIACWYKQNKVTHSRSFSLSLSRR